MKVIKPFMDKVTRKYYKVGDEYKGERVAELQSAGVLEKPKKKGGSKKKGDE